MQLEPFPHRGQQPGERRDRRRDLTPLDAAYLFLGGPGAPGERLLRDAPAVTSFADERRGLGGHDRHYTSYSTWQPAADQLAASPGARGRGRSNSSSSP